jgi:hypothetical protein
MQVTRPRGSRLLEAQSPKLGRRVRFYDPGHFGQWVRLEADPGVVAFCENPRFRNSQKGAPIISFWVQRRGADDEFQILTGDDAKNDR